MASDGAHAGAAGLSTPAGRSMRVLVAIPCLNEGATIGSVVLKARKHADAGGLAVSLVRWALLGAAPRRLGGLNVSP